MQSREEIHRNFTYHKPDDGMVDRMVDIRDHAKWLADIIFGAAPACPERTLALRKLEQAVMYANAAIVRPPLKEKEDPA